MKPYAIPPAGQLAGVWSGETLLVSTSAPPTIIATKFNAEGDRASLFIHEHPVNAAVLRAISTVRDSGAAVIGFGLNRLPAEKLGSASPKAIEYALREALAPMVTRGDIAVDSLVVETDQRTGRVTPRLSFTNLRTNKKVSTT